MNYIGENNKLVSSKDINATQQRLFEFHVDKHDFFLSFHISWDVIDGDVFVVSVGAGSFTIPSGMFVMIGDDYGDIDWIKIDELIARPLSIATFDVDFNNWGCSTPVVTDVVADEFYWPATKHIIPIQSNGVVILLSERDQYQKFQDKQIEIFTQME